MTEILAFIDRVRGSGNDISTPEIDHCGRSGMVARRLRLIDEFPVLSLMVILTSYSGKRGHAGFETSNPIEIR